jgi:hypothetical protein
MVLARTPTMTVDELQIELNSVVAASRLQCLPQDIEACLAG